MTSQADFDDLIPRLQRFVRKRVRDAHAAEDIVQDALLKLHQHRGALPREPRRILGWALRVARNAIVDHYRARAGRPLPLEAIAGVEPVVHESAESPSAELARCLPALVRRLPEAYRVPVELADLGGLPQHRVATALGLTLSGAKSRVQRGRRQLLAMLSQCCRVTRAADGGVAAFEPNPRAAEYCGAAGAGDETCVHSVA